MLHGCIVGKLIKCLHVTIVGKLCGFELHSLWALHEEVFSWSVEKPEVCSFIVARSLSFVGLLINNSFIGELFGVCATRDQCTRGVSGMGKKVVCLVVLMINVDA